MIAIAYALRSGRWGLIGFGALGFVSTLMQTLSFYRVAGNTPPERAAFGRNVSALALELTALLPPPVRPDTAGGYVQYMALGTLAVGFAVWALVSAAGAARWDEERGLTEAILATSLGRLAMVLTRVVAFACSAFVAAAAAGAAMALAAWLSGDSFPLQPIFEAAASLAALGMFCYCLTFLIVQLTPARAAVAVAGAVLLALFLLNSLSRTLSSLVSLRPLSPFHYYELSGPVAPGGGLDVRATLTLVAAGVVLAIGAGLAFASRDLGSPLFTLPPRARPRGYDAATSAWWRIPVARDLYLHRAALAAWTVGMAALAAVFVAVTRAAIQPVLAIPEFGRIFAGLVNREIFVLLLDSHWFGTAQLLLAAFAITVVARWAADDAEGRLELALAQPRSRSVVVVERAASLAAGSALIATVCALVVGYASHLDGIELDRGKLAAASLLLIPFTLVFGAAGSLLTSWHPRSAVGLLGAFAFASYLDFESGAIVQWPDWAQDLSAFKLYGSPLLLGVDRLGVALMILLALAGFAGSILAMAGRDVGS
ncbi:MAG: hypothetical protein ACREOM_12630 [Candidatus Dormibacteraceae bacterium]